MNTMDINKLLESDVLERYVMGDVTAEEESMVHQALQADEKVRETLTEIENTFLQLSRENALRPNPRLKSTILNKIDQLSTETEISFSEPYRFWKRMTAIAATIGALILIGGAYYYEELKQLELEHDELQGEYIALSNSCNENEDAARKNQEVLAFLQNPKTAIIPLDPLDNQSATANAYWNTSSQQALINVSALPALDKNEVYQLWADIEGEMISMGVLASTTTLQEIPFMSAAESLNITIEPEGGSEHPTVERLVVSGKV